MGLLSIELLPAINQNMVPYNQRILKVNLPFEATMLLIRQALDMTRAHVEQIESGERRGVALATHGFNFWSRGENIMILVETSNAQTIVRMVSKSASLNTRRDWGKNRRNLDGIEKAMQRLLASRQESLFAPGLLNEDTPYKVLDIAPDATRAEIVEAYHQKVRLYHPDRLAGLAPELRELAEERMKAINAAYAWALAQINKE